MLSKEGSEVEVQAESSGHLSAEKCEGSTKMKKLTEVQDAGLQIEYRCPKSRQCSDCLNPIETACHLEEKKLSFCQPTELKLRRFSTSNAASILRMKLQNQ